MKNPINKNATITLDEVNTMWFHIREGAQAYAIANNLSNWEVKYMRGPAGKMGYRLTWKIYK